MKNANRLSQPNAPNNLVSALFAATHVEPKMTGLDTTGRRRVKSK